MIKKIFRIIRSWDTNLSFLVPIIIALVWIGVWDSIYEKIFLHEPDLRLRLIGFDIFLFFLGLPGFFTIIKREFPRMMFLSICGKPAVLLGSIWILFFWGGVCLGLYRTFTN